MRIAIPLAEGRLAMHFGHCQEFALIDIDPEKGEIVKQENLPSPDHQPGLLPRWLAENGAEVIVAGGMGQRAQMLFAEAGIKVLVGAPSEVPEKIVADYISGSLTTGDNICDH